MKKELPHNWVETDLGSILYLNYGKSLPKMIRSGEGFPVLGSNGVVDFHEDYLVVGPGIVVGRKGSHGEVTWIDENFFPIDTTYYVEPKEGVDLKWTYNLLKSIDLKSLNRSTAIPGLNRNDAYQLIIGLPPLPEQQRIVAKLDGLFAHLEEVKTRLAKVPELLKQFRQSVLTQAVTGRLTENSGEWKKSTLGNHCKITMGQSPPGSTYNENGIGTPLINGPVEFGGLDPFSKTKSIKFTTAPAKMCEEGDLLICVRGSTTGRLNIAGFSACIGRGVAAIKAETVDQNYINIFMRLQYNKILNEGTGSTFPSISGDYIKAFNIAFPVSNIKQTEIVCRVDNLFSKADAIEAKYKALKAEIDTLPQAILAKAFKGELVEQLETDGSAKELLEEIKKLKLETKNK